MSEETVDLIELVFGKEAARQLREYNDYLVVEDLLLDSEVGL